MLEEIINVCTKLKITPNQFLLYKLIEEQNIALSYKYCNEVAMFDVKDIEVLLKKDFILPRLGAKIIKTPNGEFIIKEYELDNFISTSKVEDLLQDLTIVDKDSMFEELWVLYPNKVALSNGNTGIAKACDMEAAEKKYFKAIRNSKKTHDKVIEYVKNMIKKTGGLANMNFINFIGSRAWEVTDDNPDFFDPVGIL